MVLRLEHGVDLAHHLVEEVGLDREDHEILRAGLGGALDRPDPRHLLAAVLPDQLQAVVLDRGELRALVDHGHRMAGARELRRHQAADRAGADHADAHRPGRPLAVAERHLLHEGVAQGADALDRDLDGVAGAAHGADPDRGAAGDHVARQERHVARQEADQPVRLKDHVADRVVLALLAVEHGADRQTRRVEAGRDHRAEHAERVEALGARPLGEGRVLGDEVGGGDVVDAGVAEDVVLGLGLADVAAALADDDAELALVDHVAAVGGRPADGLAMGEEGARRLQEVERLVRLGDAQARGQRVEVVPQADHLGRRARGQHLDLGERQRRAGRPGILEHVALVHPDGRAIERAEPGLPLVLEPDPACHPYLPSLLPPCPACADHAGAAAPPARPAPADSPARPAAQPCRVRLPGSRGISHASACGASWRARRAQPRRGRKSRALAGAV